MSYAPHLPSGFGGKGGGVVGRSVCALLAQMGAASVPLNGLDSGGPLESPPRPRCFSRLVEEGFRKPFGVPGLCASGGGRIICRRFGQVSGFRGRFGSAAW